MAKLNLKHLAAYLPYSLGVALNFKEGDGVDDWCCGSSMGVTTDYNQIGIEDLIKGKYRGRDIKPVLRPMSDLGLSEYWFLIEDKSTFNDFKNVIGDPLSLPQRSVDNLISLGFDVYDLIGEGLALSIHEVNKNSTEEWTERTKQLIGK